MKGFTKIRESFPSLKPLGLAVLSSLLLTLAFPDFELWFLAWFALIPIFAAIDLEKDSFLRSFILGWICGTLFFFLTCWRLTFAPITYAKVPAVVAYILLFCATAAAGLFTGLFGGLFAVVLRRFGLWGILAAPPVWVAAEFLRYWLTGNNWNTIGYSQAFNGFVNLASIGGVHFVGFFVAGGSAVCYWYLSYLRRDLSDQISGFHPDILSQKAVELIWKGAEPTVNQRRIFDFSFKLFPVLLVFGTIFSSILFFDSRAREPFSKKDAASYVIAVQPNVPMSGLTQAKWISLRTRQTKLAEAELRNPSFFESSRRQAELDALPGNIEKRTRFYEELARESFKDGKKIVILPESPMNFQYENDPGFREFIGAFARRNNVSVLFNSAEPDRRRKNGFFNSAVMINEKGDKIAQYDKIHLLPFGEFVPLPDPLEQLVPTMVGRFSPGEEYDLLPFGDAKGGIMICFESHFPSLSREFVRNGADILVEMTNDGYLGNTPVLRQHLASAVFRAVETNRPVLRATNVGITAYINERGAVLEEAGVYQEATRAWSVAKSDGGQTLYVRFGDWFAWFCLAISLALLFLCFWTERRN